MKAALLNGIRDISIGEFPDPVIGDGDALIRIRSIGVCGSDVHYYTHGRIGRYIAKPPFILGHECAGEVLEVGKDVTNVKPGDRVAVEPGVPCRRCGFCKSGRYNLCRNVVFLAAPPYHGAFCEYLGHAADFLFPIPDEVSFDEAAMCEPLSIGIHSVARSGIKLGDRVLIIGVGPIGLANLQAFLSAGAGEIYVSDLDPARLEFAKKMGATHGFDARDPELAAKLRDLTEGLGPEIIVETAGSAEATAASVDIVRPGGVVVLVGLSPEGTVPMNTITAIDKEIDMRGIFRYANTYPAALSLIARGAVDVKSIVTARYPLDETAQAMADVADRKPGIIKACVTN
jgi:L-iditol 2-dehydrogenase